MLGNPPLPLACSSPNLGVDMYSHVLGQSPQFDRSARWLHERVKQEVRNSMEACRTKGMLEMFMTGDAGAPP